MAKIHHPLVVGMGAVNAKVGNENATEDELRAEFVKIYKGDDGSPYQACNAVWALVPDINFWSAGTPEPPGGVGRIGINADGWKRWLTQIKNANVEVNGGNLKGRISRNLSGLLAGAPDGSWAPWSTSELSSYAHQLCQSIETLGLGDTVGAWYLDDEGLKHLWYSTCTVIQAAEIIHQVQKEYGPTGNRFNFPFHISEDLTIYQGQPINGTTIPLENCFWVIENNKWVFRVPPTLQARIDAFFTRPILSDAKVIFLPFFYPWGNASDAWRYRKHVVNAEGVLNTLLPDNPPWMNWKTAMDKLREVFTPAQYPLSKLEFQVFTDASKQGATGVGVYPRHVDLHKAIRVLLNLRKHWLDLGDTRFTGIWFMGWKKTGFPEGEAAHLHWTQPNSLRYAEAIQNEVGAGTEALTDVWKDDTGNLITSKILAVTEDVSKIPPPPTGPTPRAWRIQYRLAPSTVMRPQGAPGALVLGSNFILGKRNSFKIEVVRVSDGAVVHTIDEGYIYPFQCYANISPHGRYEEGVSAQGAHLRGTSAYWDGLWDNGALDGRLAGTGTYRAYLVINGTRLTGAGEYIDFVWT